MRHAPVIESHLRRLLTCNRDAWAPHARDMWPAVLDTRSGDYPPGDHAPRRAYRLIGAPRGSTLYWDQPSVVAAHALGGTYRAAADRYIRAFLDQCVDPGGVFQWGNHFYYDVFAGKPVAFHGGPHELRPITPAWNLFHRLAPDVTERYLRAMIPRHVYDAATGAFNRHDDGQRSHAFIEAGAILAESAAWLSARTGEAAMHDLAQRIATYSYNHRNKTTGLVPNEPDHGRWDAGVCTTEIGLWAQSLLRAADHTADNTFTDMAASALRAYLRYGYDEAAQQYRGQIAVADGSHVVPDTTGYWPRRFADVWNTDQWPTHDYPTAVGEACLTLHARTGDDAFAQGARRWAAIITASSPPDDAYGESYGRCIHLLHRAGQHFADDALTAAARRLADEAVARLYVDDMFQGFADSHLYESVDGIGYLLLALLRLDRGDDVELHGFGF